MIDDYDNKIEQYYKPENFEDIYEDAKDVKDELHKTSREGMIDIDSDAGTNWLCLECGEERIGDARVESKMRCSVCAYGNHPTTPIRP